MNTVMIVTGESSGELYGSLLAKELKSKWPELRILGVGGERMNKAGVELISGISDAFGIIEALSAYRKVRETFKKTVDGIKKFMPDVLVLIDYPDFNIKVAKVAKPLGIKILYYVSPQVWAWRKGRVKKIASLVDRMAVILPFEEGIYRKAGVTCEFVSHPILEEIESELVTRHSSLVTLKAVLGLDPNRPLLSLLPGSRPHELKRLLPLMIDVVRQFKNEFKNYQFCILLTPNTNEGRYSPYLEALTQEGVVIKKGETVKALATSDMAVVASGTATLQATFLGVPMVVVYKLSPLTYLLGRLIVNVRYISLVNILSERGVVPELLQHRANAEDIIKELKKIMFDKDYRGSMLNYYRLIKKPFSGMRASERVAEIIMEMTGWKQ
ncbi:MAG: lipid-A-disaccharide synthase [Nitrospirota bacterium]